MDAESKILRKLIHLSQTERLVLMGIITGDGDIGGRMASSHPSAEPVVSMEKRRALEDIAKEYNSAELPLDLLGSIID